MHISLSFSGIRYPIKPREGNLILCYFNSQALSTKSFLDQGKSVSILDNHFALYNEDGSKYRSDVGGHWMTITGVTDDGRYIVSSWGKKLYLKPDELDGHGIEVTDIYV